MNIEIRKETDFPGILIIGEPDYYPKAGFIRCKDCGITDAEGNSWDPYMVYEFEKGSMHILGVMEEPYDITDGIPPVPPADYESQFENWNVRNQLHRCKTRDKFYLPGRRIPR